MTPEQIEQHKQTIANFDDRIEALQERVSTLEEAKQAFMVSIANMELNSADASCRTRCGSRPRELVITQTWECETSPIGYCVYDDEDDPVHDDCLFCHDPEERK
jgi:hypothetical protein